ncbi:catechol 2,3-dioxygenase-like lactoylglutathione lyase family enzyme [Variovorax paradoxus]|jgi:catechol 2,3-dioxygenase-like lactoylglutathione lyase family enzyme|uniref:VOC family protein n=1 Tax=Variovorax paradoxus TaxID=34073 RepID=UPI00278D434E|nr:VOC family protein [Variovorax paradoxus]MDQ0571006.1 catechol 2,3-dioxygenase-like lactoylglutathione lyase family enzyme [Variovorax paradoxus]
MRINLTSIFVDDQDKALAFYTQILGFVKNQDFPVGKYKWLSVKSPEGGDTELSLEPNANPAALAYQQALMSQGVPAIAFESDNLEADVKRLREHGVRFTQDPADHGPVRLAVFADTCGNLIQVYQHRA